MKQFLLSICIVLLIGCEQNSYAKAKITNNQKVDTHTMTTSKQFCLSQLHRVKNRDDLIRQMYQTAILDDCLYDLSVEELADIWKIPMMTMQNENVNIQSPIDLYVVKWNWQDNSVLFSLRVPSTAVEEKQIIYSDYFPEFLPIPNSKLLTIKRVTDKDNSANRKQLKMGEQVIKTGFIQPNVQYYWHNEKREMFAHNGVYGIMFFTFTNDLKLTQLNYY